MHKFASYIVILDAISTESVVNWLILLSQHYLNKNLFLFLLKNF